MEIISPSCSLKDQLNRTQNCFIEPISIPSMKHVGVRSELTDPKRSSDLLLEDDDLDEDDNIISKTKSNASKKETAWHDQNECAFDVRQSEKYRRLSSENGRKKTKSQKTRVTHLFQNKHSNRSPTLESEWFSKYRKSKVVKDRKARAPLRLLESHAF